MDKPKYKIGDQFIIPKQVEAQGLLFKSEFKFVIIGIMTSGGSKGAEFKYTLAKDFPQAYWQPADLFYEYEGVLDAAGKVGSIYG